MVIIYIKSKTVAEQIIKLLADNRISSSQWKYNIPDFITDQNLALLSHAKNLANGINEHLERKGLDMIDEYVVSSKELKIHMNSESEEFIDGHSSEV